MNHDSYGDSYLAGIFDSVRTIAVLGASPKPERPSNSVARFLAGKGYRIFPVNPGQPGKEIAGAMTYASLAELPEPVDMIDVFRGASDIPRITDEILAMRQLPKIVWMQLGIRHDPSALRLEERGIAVVMDRCPAMEIPRLMRSGWVRPPAAARR